MSRTVLVVDDEPLIRMLLADLLAEAGLLVEEARDGREALALHGARIGAVLLDLGLPDMDGLEVLRRLKALDPCLPILVITGHGGEYEAAANALGADAFFHKPFDSAEVVARVGSMARQPARLDPA